MVDNVEIELTKTKAELDKILDDHSKLKEEVASKEKKLQENISKQEEQLSSLKLECDRLKNQVWFHFNV